MSKQDELLFKVVERYLYHEKYEALSPLEIETRELLLNIEVAEMWMLTQ